jgi:hypothetical protein
LGKKYRCEICKKGFCGEEFVHKHIKNKHGDVLNSKVCKGYFKQIAREAYFKDENRLENPPIGNTFNNYQNQP